MKKRILMFGLGLICVALLVTLGYSAWAISYSHTDSKTGNVDAYAVSDNGMLTMNLGNWANNTFTEGSESIVFGKSDATEGWLKASSDVAAEDLVTYIQIDFQKVGDWGDSESYTLQLTSQLMKNDTDVTSDNANLIGNAQFAIVAGEVANKVTLSNNQLTIKQNTATKVVLSVTYSWGTAFGGNPYTLAGEGGTLANATNAQKQDMLTKLQNLNTLCNGLTFKITVADVPAA